MKNLIIVTLVLFLTSGCSHRIIHKTQNKIDSTQSLKKQWLEIDTSKYQTYERMFIFPFRSNKLNSDSTAYNGLITSPMLPDITDASTWPPELIVKYIKSLPDNINFQNLPIYYERISTNQNGFSKKEKSEIITKVKKAVKKVLFGVLVVEATLV